jgi:hypothetical protein
MIIRLVYDFVMIYPSLVVILSEAWQSSFFVFFLECRASLNMTVGKSKAWVFTP